jgi:hypothetical protein
VSRPRSGRASTVASPRPSSRSAGGRPGVFVQAPKSDIYVALLGVALGAMFIGCILLVLVLQRYEFKFKAASLTPNAASATALA